MSWKGKKEADESLSASLIEIEHLSTAVYAPWLMFLCILNGYNGRNIKDKATSWRCIAVFVKSFWYFFAQIGYTCIL